MKAPDAYKTFLATLSARRNDREKGAAWVKENPQWESTMVELALESSAEKTQQRSAWVMEIYFLEQLDALKKYLPLLLAKTPEIEHESVRRPISKLLYHYSKSNALTTKQIDQLVAIAFDWLIAPAQVATLNFALRILHHYQNHKPWIKGQLVEIVKQQLPNASAGYRSAAREILK